MAEFARLWTSFTGRRVIGLTTSTNAARVLEHEGLAESYNIAEFLGKVEGSGELRRPVPLHQDDVLVLDEASQLSTADLAMIGEAARQAGARIIATGDTAQLGAVEAGGMFRLLAGEVPAAELHEVRRFEARWEREASVRLRDGDVAAVAEALASQLAVEKTRLEAMNATYEGWAGSTRTVREAAGKAKAELGRRHQAQPEESSQTMARWWRQLDADLDAMDRAISRERQAAMAAGKPWPPEKTAQAPNRRSEAGAVAEPLQRDGDLRAPDYDLPVSGPGPAESGAEALAPRHEPGVRPARLDALQARADEAAQRIAADNAERQARAQYTARIVREAHAEPQIERQAETSDDAEIEM